MGKITINELHKSLFDYVQAVSDDKLETNNKTIVGAINELFSDNSNDIEINNLKNEISNGKELIANAIGEPLTAEDSFDEMSNDINSLLSTFKTNIMNAGIAVESGDKFKALIDKIKGLTEGEGNKGIQFAEGTITTDINHTFKGTTGNLNVKFDNPLEFTPTYIVLCDVYLRHYAITTNIVTNLSNINASEVGTNTSIILTGLSSTGFNISYTGVDSYGGLNITCSFYNPKYIAIGVGEEDTTLRDSLANILENKGVEVTEEDDMASLIGKVDSMRVVDPNERLISNYYYPFEITRTYTTITNMDYTIRDNIIYYFVEGATGSSTSAREAYIYKYNMDTKTVVKSLKVDKNTSSTSESIFLEDNILIFSYTSVTLYSYDDLSQIKTTTFGGTLCAGAKFLKYENYIYGLVLNGLVFKFDIDAFKTVKSVTMSSDYKMNVPCVLIIDNGFIYAGSAYAGTGNGPYYKFDMDLTLKTNTGTITVFSGGSFIMNGYVYSVSAFFNGGTTPALNIYKIDMNTSGNTIEVVQNLMNLNSIFTPCSTQNLMWKYFIVNDEVFMTYSNVIAKFNKNDIETFTTDTPTYFCVPSSGENIINITSNGDCYEITTIGQRGVSIFKSSDFC